MSPRDATEVRTGAGTLYIAILGTAYPIDPTVAPAAAWVERGYSEEGWRLFMDRSFDPIRVEEEVLPVDYVQTEEVLAVEGAMAQANLDNLKEAFGGTIATAVGPPATKTWTPPVAGTRVEVALLLRVPSIEKPTGKQDIQLPRVVPVAAIEKSHRRTEKQLIAARWEALVPATGDRIKIVEET